MNKFISEDILRPLLYSGKNLAEREGFVFKYKSQFCYSQLFRLRIKYQQNPKEYTVLVASYDVVRSDISFFSYVIFVFINFIYFILFF
jgi:hypothetical protein